MFVGILHAIALGMSFYIFRENKGFFIVSEVVILISIWVSSRLYLQLIRPLQALVRGADAIRERDFNVRFMATGKDEMDKLIGVYNEMMDHLREERTRQEEQHFFLEKMIYTSPTGIVVLDYDEQVYQVNPKVLAILEMEASSLVGRAIGVVDHPLVKEMQRLNTGESVVVSRNGVETYKIQKSHFVDRGFERHFIMIEEMTEEILAAEKRAYGKVIRMMAHEVNNTVGPVNSIMSSTLGEVKGNVVLEDALTIAIQRNMNLNHFMRNFADVVRLPVPVKKIVDVVGLLERVAGLMRMQAGAGQRIEILKMEEGDEGAWTIMADEHQMEQVLINIVKNALEALAGEGRVIMYADRLARKLVIRDTGTGIDPHVADQLFSPFFSTKRNGQGIGLTLIREILIGHGFLFSLRTAGGYTEFEIRV